MNTPQREKPPVLAVSSGKGGAGKTIVAVNLALRFAAQGVRTLLVDLDPGLANVDVHMRLAGRLNLEDILLDRCQAEAAVMVGPSGLLIIPGGKDGRLIQDDSVPRRILGRLSPLFSRVDLIILDTGAGIGSWVLGSVEEADQPLIVTQPDPASVTDAYALLKLCRRRRPDSRPALVVNRVKDRREATLTATRMRRVAKRFLAFEPELLGWLHEDPAVTVSVKNQTPFFMELPREHRLVLDLGAIAAQTMSRLGIASCRAGATSV
ncbi:MAG: AAA family ATPase [Planctomycetota bacterium]